AHLWKSDGTPESTEIVATFESTSFQNTSTIIPLADRILFAGFDDTHGAELWTHIPFSPPYVARSLPNVTVDEGASPTSISLEGAFAGRDRAELALSVSTSNPALVTPEIVDGQLVLTFAAADGMATVTVTATDGDGLQT